ncbi:MAG: hypothetical protein U9Q03_03070 [Patescibacteria group bacterium]|nr:hypothetical protein [Patescibacteria group bacterium]
MQLQPVIGLEMHPIRSLFDLNVREALSITPPEIICTLMRQTSDGTSV